MCVWYDLLIGVTRNGRNLSKLHQSCSTSDYRSMIPDPAWGCGKNMLLALLGAAGGIMSLRAAEVLPHRPGHSCELP